MSDENSPWTLPEQTPPASGVPEQAGEAAAAPVAPVPVQAQSVEPPVQTPVQPQPRFGEYAPGYAPQAAPAAPPAAQQPAYGQAPLAQGTQLPPYVQPGAQLGQVPVAYPAPGQPYAPGYQPQPVPRQRNTVDVVFTIIMLGVGLLAMSYSVLEAFALNQIYAVYGISGTEPSFAWAQVTILVSQPLIYLVCLGVTILLLVKRRLSFWVPLSCGILAALVFWGVLIGALASDPNILHHFQNAS